ncbi:MAG: DUF4097 domain-containing protein [Bacteroidales bacterium]|nr:DUF4097 domain-containing protein [Bacteroidales bacterium]
MKRLNKAIILSAAVLLAAGNSYAQKKEMIHKEFEGKTSVRISTVSGDCVIKQGSSDKILVDVVHSVRPAKAFNPDISERGNSLRIKERWSGSSSSGDVTWTLTVPPKTEIEFSTASGDLTINSVDISLEASTASGDIIVEDSKGKFDVSTASGDVEAYNISGEIEMSTASGEIDIKDSNGMFELSCASGDIDAKNIIIEEESSFSTASGDVDVILAKSSEYDLELSAASGDVCLDYNGNAIKGYFELTAKKRGGKISSPIKFDNEEEFGKNDRTYVKKSFTKGSGNPKIYIETASGKATLKK